MEHRVRTRATCRTIAGYAPRRRFYPLHTTLWAALCCRGAGPHTHGLRRRLALHAQSQHINPGRSLDCQVAVAPSVCRSDRLGQTESVAGFVGMRRVRLERRFEATLEEGCRLAINHQHPIRLGPQRSPHEYHVFVGRADTLVGNQRRDDTLSYAVIASPRN